MASQKQIAANRLNACKSTGPRSAEGKARSSMNALQTGIHAQSQVIRGEFERALETLTDEYYERFHPTTPEQRALVDTLIDSEWLLRRFRKAEAQLWEEAANDTPPSIHALTTGHAFRTMSEVFIRLQRRIDATHRTYRNTLRELERLQSAQALESEPDPDPATSTIQATKPQNGFVPSTLDGPPLDQVRESNCIDAEALRDESTQPFPNAKL